MQALSLRAHYGQPLEVDLCETCRLVWFDGLESVQLSSTSWIDLLLALEDRDTPVTPPEASRLGCPHCARPLDETFNQTRWGRFRSLGCPAGHGWLQPQTQLLAERGLLRPPTRGERAAMAAEHQTWHCLNCGAPTVGREADCTHCRTPLLLFDLPRLAEALLPRPADRPTASGGRLHAWACHACGSPMDPTLRPVCAQCDHPAVAARFDDLRPLLKELRRTALGLGRTPPPLPHRPRKQPLATTFGQIVHFFWRDAAPGLLRWLAPVALATGLLLFLLVWR